MSDNNLTLFQKLFNVINTDDGYKSPKYAFDEKDLIVTKSKEEYERQTLELKQQQYLNTQWNRVDSELYQKSLFYETTRIASYIDFESMEYFPEIATALDIFAEESCTLNEYGGMLKIQSESKRVKNILTDLFVNVLDIQTNLPMWTRNAVKYGDNFVYLKIDRKKGIVGTSQLTNIEIERHEMDFKNRFKNTDANIHSGVKFTWKEKNLEFNNWEIAHFRLLGDDRKLPYGNSILEKTRRIWKQLLLAEDAMLIYRTIRAPERRVFKVFVGNMDDKDVDAYVQKFANKFKRTPRVDNKSGQQDFRYNSLSIDQDYFIPVRDIAAPNPIETLPGATNLSDIADIEFLHKKLLTALRVPKAFLGFEEAAGDGKNLSLQDVRFARTINKIQQSMIRELNKIAIIHLYILGLEDELDNFQLFLTNPSTQGEMMKIEEWKEKVLLYKDMTQPIEGGIAPTSHTFAKKQIFNFSEDEIILDLERQRIERAAGTELENTSKIIKKTGIFDKIDRLYGVVPDESVVESGQKEDDMGDMGDMGGGGSFSSPSGDFGGDLGGEIPDLGGEIPDLGGEIPDLGGEIPDLATDLEQTDTELPPTDTEFGESFNNDKFLDNLLIDNVKRNSDITQLINEINKLVKE